jgi:hypothetical protein
MATLTCSTAVDCCLVENPDLARHIGRGADETRNLLNADATLPNCREPASTPFDPVSVAIAVVFTAADIIDQTAHVAGAVSLTFRLGRAPGYERWGSLVMV